MCAGRKKKTKKKRKKFGGTNSKKKDALKCQKSPTDVEAKINYFIVQTKRKERSNNKKK